MLKKPKLWRPLRKEMWRKERKKERKLILLIDQLHARFLMGKVKTRGGFFSLWFSYINKNTWIFQQRRCSQFPATDKIEIWGELSYHSRLNAKGWNGGEIKRSCHISRFRKRTFQQGSYVLILGSKKSD